MAEEQKPIKDKLALAVAEARREAELAKLGKRPPAGKTPVDVVPPDQAALAEVIASKATVIDPAIFAPARAAIAADENPVVLARRLTALLEGGINRQAVADGVGKSKSWLSKMLALLSAPKEIQRLIESGEMAYTDYHDNRQTVTAGVKGRGETLRYQRKSRAPIYSEAAHDLALILQQLAAQHGAAPIRVDANTKLKDLTNILNLRSGEIWRLLKK